VSEGPGTSGNRGGDDRNAPGGARPRTGGRPASDAPRGPRGSGNAARSGNAGRGSQAGRPGQEGTRRTGGSSEGRPHRGATGGSASRGRPGEGGSRRYEDRDSRAPGRRWNDDDRQDDRDRDRDRGVPGERRGPAARSGDTSRRSGAPRPGGARPDRPASSGRPSSGGDFRRTGRPGAGRPGSAPRWADGDNRPGDRRGSRDDAPGSGYRSGRPSRPGGAGRSGSGYRSDTAPRDDRGSRPYRPRESGPGNRPESGRRDDFRPRRDSGERRSSSDRSDSGDRRTFSDRRDSGDRRSYSSRPDSGERRGYGDRRETDRRDSGRRGDQGSRPGAGGPPRRSGSFSRDGGRDQGSRPYRDSSRSGGWSGDRRRDDGPGDRRPGGGRDEGEARPPRESGPRIPDSITPQQLDADARAQLDSLPNDLADTVARYLVAAGLAEDPEQGYGYAQAAKRLAARVGVVREAGGIAAYRTGRWAEALSELRAARRMTGRDDYLPIMADCERALGRPDRALALVREANPADLSRAAQIELRIVESGIRRDQGLPEAAVLVLQVPELTSSRIRPWSARLFYAYGDALLAADRPGEARDAFLRAAEVDPDGETDAAERLDELDGVTFEDLEDEDYLDDDAEEDEGDDDPQAALDDLDDAEDEDGESEAKEADQDA